MKVTLVGSNLRFVSLDSEVHVREHRYTLCAGSQEWKEFIPQEEGKGKKETEQEAEKRRQKGFDVRNVLARPERSLNGEQVCEGCLATLRKYDARYVSIK